MNRENDPPSIELEGEWKAVTCCDDGLTTDEVDVSPPLVELCKTLSGPQRPSVFIYNWRNNGDPANHNWTENFPSSLRLDSVPAKSPYPAPSWISPPSTLAYLVLPIPHPPIPPPIPNRGHNPGQEQQSVTSPPPPTVTPSSASPEQKDYPESGEQPTAKDSVSTSLFAPYKPPAQHPSHGRLLNRKQGLCEEASSSRASPPSLKFIKKLDPYELDEDALNALRSPGPDQDTKGTENEDIKPIPLLSVKVEIANIKTENDDSQHHIASASDSRYRPSQALVDAFNSLRQPEQTPPSARPPIRDPRGRPNATSEIVPPRSGYRPSVELEAEINALLRGKTPTASSPSSGSDALPIPGTFAVAIKREYDSEDDVATSLVGERKKIKIEEY
jgi:hypothetical protein